MATAHHAQQLVATLPTRVGLLADVTDAIRSAGVNITAISGYERDGQAKFLLVTDDNAKAAEALGRLNAEVREKDVVLVELNNRVGSLADAAKKLAEADINIEYAYGTTGPGDKAWLVFKTADDTKTLGLF
jgi:hypothetical protein